jgi:hypothetical protein
MTMCIDEIRLFLKDYFEVLQSQDMALFDQVFHPTCVLYSAQNGDVVVRPFEVYKDMVKGRASPASQNSPRDDHILMIDMLSDEMAMAKVQLRLFDSIMIDHLNLMKINGQWIIMAKHFSRKGSAV